MVTRRLLGVILILPFINEGKSCFIVAGHAKLSSNMIYKYDSRIQATCYLPLGFRDQRNRGAQSWLSMTQSLKPASIEARKTRVHSQLVQDSL